MREITASPSEPQLPSLDRGGGPATASRHTERKTMMRFTRRTLRSIAALLVVGGALAACSDDDPTGPEEHAEPVRAELFLRDSDIRLADTHDDHWHGSLSMGVGVSGEFDVHFLDADGDVIPLEGEYTVRAEIVAGEPTGIVSAASHGDHIEITGLAPGATRVVIHFWHDSHADWSTPPLGVVVTAP
jgi:hypothetical protein